MELSKTFGLVSEEGGVTINHEHTQRLWHQVIRNYHTQLPEACRPGHGREERQQLHTIPCSWDGLYSTKHHL